MVRCVYTKEERADNTALLHATQYRKSITKSFIPTNLGHAISIHIQ